MCCILGSYAERTTASGNDNYFFVDVLRHPRIESKTIFLYRLIGETYPLQKRHDQNGTVVDSPSAIERLTKQRMVTLCVRSQVCYLIRKDKYRLKRFVPLSPVRHLYIDLRPLLRWVQIELMILSSFPTRYFTSYFTAFCNILDRVRKCRLSYRSSNIQYDKTPKRISRRFLSTQFWLSTIII